jgi:hypothetical protein
MSWERRPGTQHRYYTRFRRASGKVSRQYVGRGPHAEDLALVDERERVEREQERQTRRAEQARLEDVAAAIQEYDDMVELLARAVLHAAGYHAPNRSQWRRRRE